ncbi:hypothetical protein FN846DRAFT_1002255 [Sphaerosporella brunnea]|uniref:Uncharacterized protein n=1 Tax=Sphaerosporella brunnea TaxID=1250544 RepID=A0A5J5F496_9PEZI|nr:hypothetical protein FN846DRAFT_1002255 [Sphaerosporella brunnea]
MAAMEPASTVTNTALPTAKARNSRRILTCQWTDDLEEVVTLPGPGAPFSITDDPEQHVYYLDRQLAETWKGTNMGVVSEMEIDMHTIRDMFGDIVDPAHWDWVNQEMPEYARQQKAKHEIVLCVASSDLERLADRDVLDRTITVETSEQRLIITPASPPRRTGSLVTIASDASPTSPE